MLRRQLIATPFKGLTCVTPYFVPVAQTLPHQFNVKSMLLYSGVLENKYLYFAAMQKKLDNFVTKWAKYKLGIDLTITGDPVVYNDLVTLDPNNHYGIAPLYQALEQHYNQYNLWLTYVPFYTPRPLQNWAGFYDTNKMVLNTYIDNGTLKDETYLISEEMLHALLDKLGYPYATSVELVHTNRQAGLADFFDSGGNFITSGNTRDLVPNAEFITVGGSY